MQRQLAITRLVVVLLVGRGWMISSSVGPGVVADLAESPLARDINSGSDVRHDATSAATTTTSSFCDGVESRTRGMDLPGNSTYSMVVVAGIPHWSNLFRDRERVCSYSKGVVSVQIAKAAPAKAVAPGSPPFFVGHPTAGVDKRVRILHILNPKGFQAPHMRVACEDTSERTVLLWTDETCDSRAVHKRTPQACLSNTARHYPDTRVGSFGEAYIPTGPTDSFPFVRPSRRTLASLRGTFFSLQVGPRTSPRRPRLIYAVTRYHEQHDYLPAHVNGRRMPPEDFQQLAVDTKFTLCPGGQNPETYRMFEALEAGSIPIVSRQDYLYPAYHAPFPCGKGHASWNTVAASPFAKAVSVATWEDLPDLLDALQLWSSEEIDKLQADCVAWYEALMTRTYASVLNFGEGLDFFPHKGPIELDGFPAAPAAAAGWRGGS